MSMTDWRVKDRRRRPGKPKPAGCEFAVWKLDHKRWAMYCYRCGGHSVEVTWAVAIGKCWEHAVSLKMSGWMHRTARNGSQAG